MSILQAEASAEDDAERPPLWLELSAYTALFPLYVAARFQALPEQRGRYLLYFTAANALVSGSTAPGGARLRPLTACRREKVRLCMKKGLLMDFTRNKGYLADFLLRLSWFNKQMKEPVW